MDIAGVDLNLLGPLAALLDERHVSRAAVRMRMSQPAMSRALQRLRATLGDELLVRGAGEYLLTPRAERLRKQLTTLVPTIESLFTEREFDARESANAFRLAGTDYTVSVLGSALLRTFYDRSPNSTISFEGWHRNVYADAERGTIDIVIHAGIAPPALRSAPLFDEPPACLVAVDHPIARGRRPTLDRYLASDHVVVAVADGRQGNLDRRLEALGRPRKAALTVPYHAAAAAAIPGTRLVATLPADLADALVLADVTVARPAPIELEPLRCVMSWHPRLDHDPAHCWLRNLIAETSGAAR